MPALRRTVAVLIAIRGLTNLGKPFGAGTGFVVLGHLLHGVWSAWVAPVFGLAMVGYAWLLWRPRPAALPVGIAFAIWSTLNVLLFPAVEAMPPNITVVQYAGFALAGIIGPWAAVWLAGRTSGS